MSWDGDRVRIELCDVMSVQQGAGGPEMAARSAAEIWLSDQEGRFTRRRKPDFRLVGGDRLEVLSQIAGWFEAHPDDQGLVELAAEIASQKQAARAVEQAGAGLDLEL
jgi:hypothetical protein